MENNILAMILGGSIFILLLVIALYAVYVIGLWKLFKKAGKQGWEAIIPFYNTYVLVEISGCNWWYFLIAISGTILGMLKINGLDYVANIATLVTRFFIFWNIGKKMKQNHVPIAILGTLFAPVMVMILGLSSSYQFDSNVSVSPNGPFGEEKQGTSNNERFCLGCGVKLKPNAKFCDNCGKKVD